MEKNHRLFLRNLSKNVKNDDINEVFKNYGDITKIDIKEKANDNFSDDDKFAFVNITTTERKLNTCFNELKDLVICGCKVHMEIAKESFLARLQREREESKISVKPVPITVVPKAVIEFNSGAKLDETIVKPKPEIVFKINKKPLYIAPQKIPQKIIDAKNKDVVVDKPEEVLEIDSKEQRMKNEADEKRLKSLMEKKMAFKMREGLIRKALNTVDQKPLGKKIIFSDNIEDLGKANTAIKKQKPLFDDDDNDDDQESSNLPENDEFRVRENVNPKLQKLQSNFGNDKRFTLDNRFVEDEDNKEEYQDPLTGIQGERDWQLEILQNVLGKPMKIHGSDETGEKNRKRGMMRYDPTKKDHAECEIPVKKQALKKPDRVKKIPGENGDIEKEKLPELSKDTFFNVSDKLVDTLKQDGQFSLLKAFGAAEPSIEYFGDGKIQEQEHRFNFSEKNPFKYDSSDNEDAEEEVGERITAVKKSELKNDWNDSLFFNANDIRFEDGRKFFSKESKADSEFSTLRRNLRQIVRTKVQKNLRKKVTWKKIKQYKS